MSAQTKIVSFSGIDGAGKSTQIEALLTHLQGQGFRTLLLTFWDDVVVLPHFREFMSRKAFKGDAGVGSPDKPIQRRDKNVVSWYAIAPRLFLYLLDAISLRFKVWQLSRQVDFVVFDRYIYDELANLHLHRWTFRPYVKLLLAISPKASVAYLVDADPEAAYARKPEYPLEFLRGNRAAYHSLRRLVPQMEVVGPDCIEAITLRILRSIAQHSSGINSSMESRVPCSATGEDAKSAVS